MTVAFLLNESPARMATGSTSCSCVCTTCCAELNDSIIVLDLTCVLLICRGVDLSDLIPEGTVGLEKAIERFDASKGFKFSTYAHWWIRQAVSRCITEQSRVVRLPVHVYDHVAKINKVTRSLSRQPGRQQPVTYAEIGALIAGSVSYVGQR